MAKSLVPLLLPSNWQPASQIRLLNKPIIKAVELLLWLFKLEVESANKLRYYLTNLEQRDIFPHAATRPKAELKRNQPRDWFLVTKKKCWLDTYRKIILFHHRQGLLIWLDPPLGSEKPSVWAEYVSVVVSNPCVDADSSLAQHQHQYRIFYPYVWNLTPSGKNSPEIVAPPLGTFLASVRPVAGCSLKLSAVILAPMSFKAIRNISHPW